jgi:hypothetical protein
VNADPAATYTAMSPEERAADDRKRLGTIRRVVGENIAQAMLSGDHSRQRMAWLLADDLDAVGCEVEYPIRNALKALGADYDQAWVEPAGDQKPAVNIPSLRYHLARHIAGAYVSGGDDQFARAKELGSGLDSVGLNVDSEVDRMVIEAMRSRPSDRGTGGRADTCPF